MQICVIHRNLIIGWCGYFGKLMDPQVSPTVLVDKIRFANTLHNALLSMYKIDTIFLTIWPKKYCFLFAQFSLFISWMLSVYFHKPPKKPIEVCANFIMTRWHKIKFGLKLNAYTKLTINSYSDPFNQNKAKKEPNWNYKLN